jgi:energy-converting hydrogenase Eha subunit A
MDKDTDSNINVTNMVTIAHAVQILNSALRADQQALTNLMSIFVPCVPALGTTPIETLLVDDQTIFVTALGLINGIFSYAVDGRRYRIFPVYQDGIITEFRIGSFEVDENTQNHDYSHAGDR